MLTLYGFGEALGMVDPSPFVLKVHAYCTLNNIPFEFNGSLDNLRNAPKGKVPFIEDDGEVIADSFFILEHLKQKYGDTLDANLSDDQKAIAHLFGTALDEGLIWAMAQARWFNDKSWKVVKASFFDDLPFPLRVIVPTMVRRNERKSLNAQGYGRHSDAELAVIARSQLQALSDFLGEKPYFFGDDIHGLDVHVYAFLAQLILVKLDTPVGDIAKSYANLVAFTEQTHQRIYGDT